MDGELMKYTIESLKERHLWRAEHAEEYRRENAKLGILLIFGLMFLGAGFAVLPFSSVNLPKALLPTVVMGVSYTVFGAVSLFLTFWLEARWARKMGMPKLIKKDSQTRSPTFDGR